MRAFTVIVSLLVLATIAWLTRTSWLPDPAAERGGTSTAAVAANEEPSARLEPAASPAPGDDMPSAVEVAPAGDVQAVEREAERFVATLATPDPAPLSVERADHFVTPDQMLALVPDAQIEEMTLNELGADPQLEPDTPITVVREVEEVQRLTPQRLISRSGGNLDATVQVMVRDQVRTTTVRDLLEDAERAPDGTIDLVTRTEYYEQTTPAELAADRSLRPETRLKIIKRVVGLESASVRALMRGQDPDDESLFYVRTVRAEDSQGIWGIVHHGLIANFARGVAIRRGKEINTYQVHIPRDADEPESDRSSSFLGKLIFEKANESYVYNFKRNRMGRNPDRIYPGQEIVIVNFAPEELIDIYRHFVAKRG